MVSLWELPPAQGQSELLRRIKMLEITARKNIHTTVPGNYKTKVPGEGLEFMKARKYVAGESIRMIDWAITARMNEPYVRIFHEEREREVYICLDVSPSMHTGFQKHRKIEYAVEIAATLAYTITQSRDKLGFMTYSDKVHDYYHPERTNKIFFQLLKVFYQRAVEKPAYCRESDLRQAVHKIQINRGKRFMVFFISDFIDHDFPEDLKYLKFSHDVSLIHLYDPFEYDILPELKITVHSPERDMTNITAVPGSEKLPQLQEFLRKSSSKYGIAFTSLNTRLPLTSNLQTISFQGGKR
jgi:uncharacterized protein (DUF58 family)